MSKLVGTQTSFCDAIKGLVALEFAVVAAYEAAIEGLKSNLCKSSLTDFKQDHEKHIKSLSKAIRAHRETPPDDGSKVGPLLTKDEISVADLQDDGAILEAMQSNEEDAIAAFARMSKRTDQWVDVARTLRKGQEEERLHMAWLGKIIANLQKCNAAKPNDVN